MTFMEKGKRTFFVFGPLILWSLVIFSFSSFPTVETSEIYWWDFAIKKTAHFVEYFILTILSYRAVVFYEDKLSSKEIFLICFLFSFLYAASDEYHQSFVPGREAKVRDVLIDNIGILSAIWYIKKSFPKAPKKLISWVLAGQKN